MHILTLYKDILLCLFYLFSFSGNQGGFLRQISRQLSSDQNKKDKTPSLPREGAQRLARAAAAINRDDSYLQTPDSGVAGYVVTQSLPCPVLPCPVLLCPGLSCPALPCPALPCTALPCPALPCLALPCLVLPCPALPCPVPLEPCSKDSVSGGPMVLANQLKAILDLHSRP